MSKEGRHINGYNPALNSLFPRIINLRVFNPVTGEMSIIGLSRRVFSQQSGMFIYDIHDYDGVLRYYGAANSNHFSVAFRQGNGSISLRRLPHRTKDTTNGYGNHHLHNFATENYIASLFARELQTYLNSSPYKYDFTWYQQLMNTFKGRVNKKIKNEENKIKAKTEIKKIENNKRKRPRLPLPRESNITKSSGFGLPPKNGKNKSRGTRYTPGAYF